ncbi:outer envelope pore protein 21B, chloroplastic-like [Cynara cardunculus var. scolymus]|uniref:outer envelope pore protein 21B, chloroplastic-like n=1 Tax=Cynara cardunculus var. scolymus TaxID=59895 RepID=UPI000D627987|nr:outer envelope pore protein 21B, chloroplastic-like [Cynara cardunculus var. scolymus]
METSLRYGGDSTALRVNTNKKPPTVRYAGDASALKIHAKQKFRIDSNTRLQLNGELDTRIGAPTFFSALLRYFPPELSATVGVGLQYDRREKLHYTMRGKKSFSLTPDRFASFVVKGRCDLDKEFKQPRPSGAAELVWNILDFQKDQDIRLKVGYEIVDKIPYVQVRENNWTFTADANGRWNVRYNL